MTIRISPRLIAAGLALALAGAPLAQAQGRVDAAGVSLLAAGAQDQVPAQLRIPAPGKLDASRLERAPIAASWALDADAPLDARPQPFVRESREYWVDASAAELKAGLALPLSSNGALIRLSPVHGSAGTIDASRLVVRARGGTYDAATALRNVAADADLRTAGMDVPQGSVVLRLSDAVGAGRVELVAPDADGDYLVHVYEPDSTVVLTLGADRDNVGTGQPMTVRAALAGPAALARVGGLLTAPDGYSQPVEFARAADGSWNARVEPDLAHAGDPGLWELHAFAIGSGKNAIQRDAKTAFAVTVPVARFDGRLVRSDGSGLRKAGLGLSVGIEAAVASRYQVSAVLYGSGSDGGLRPAAIAQSAAWLEAGRGAIELRFDAASLGKSGLVPPYELRDLRLVNQADMSVVERRERAVAGLR